MTDLELLARVTADPFAKALLESAREDRSAAGAAERALTGLGLAATTGVAAHGGALGAAKAGSALAGKGLLFAAQFAALGFVAGAAVVGSATYVFGPRAAASIQLPRPSSPIAPARPAPLPASDDGAGTRAVTGSTPELSAAPRPHEALTPKSVEPAGHTDLPSSAAFPASSTGSAQDLDAQLAELRVVRSRLSAPSSALTLLDAFERAHPSTPLAEEATVLRVEALANAGRQSEANALGTTFLRKNPHSAYAQRVRSELEQR